MVHGLVQGVGFRMSCARRATDAHLSGYVRNLREGAVEAVFEGTLESVEALSAWCDKGPPLAQVTRVEVFEEPLVGERGFTVR